MWSSLFKFTVKENFPFEVAALERDVDSCDGDKDLLGGMRFELNVFEF